MRRGHLLAVSSATLFLSAMLAPCHIPALHRSALAAETWGYGVLISEFYPCGLCDDEYFVLENAGDSPANLRNWTVTDGEGEIKFTGELIFAEGTCLSVSSNSTSYLRAFNRLPDICLDQVGQNTSISQTGTFRLADVGDSITLLDEKGVEVDFVVYGACDDGSSSWFGDNVPALRKGEVAKRCRDGRLAIDTNSKTDWLHFREFKYGYTDLSPVSASVGPGMLRAFVSPDCGLASVVDAIGSASTRLRLCAYEFSSTAVCSALLSAASTGIEVEVLIDGSPAGGMDEAQIACLSVLACSGAEVKVLMGNLSMDVVQHVGPMHAKYIVVDAVRFVALSENFVESGLPSDPLSGNRGWGLDVTNPVLAGYMARVFDDDSRSSRQDVRDWLSDPRYDPDAIPPEDMAEPLLSGMMGPVTTSSEATVTLLPSPDSSPREPFLRALMSSSMRLQVEQFQADLTWKDRWTGQAYLSPLVAAAEEALVRGAEVSLLLDSVWFNVEDNGEVAEHLNSFSSSRELTGEARLMDLSGPVSTLHNKGLVSDGRSTIVSSNNWGYSSFASNRELAVLVDSVEVASYFASVFEVDWQPDSNPPVADAGPDITLEIGESITLDASGSKDDRFVARCEWRLEGDGMLTALGDEATYLATRAGKQTIHLLVQDAWGNTGMDSVTIMVLPNPGTATSRGSLWVVMSVAILGVISSGIGAAAARKLNHRNRSSR